jgi:hypothetical protein
MLIGVKESTESITSRGTPMLQVTTNDGERLTCFRPELFDLLKTGAVTDIQTEKRGDFSPNITSAFRPGVHKQPIGWRTPEPATGEKPEARNTNGNTLTSAAADLSRQGRDERGRDQSIEAQTAAKNITELIIAGKIEVTGLAGQLCMAWNIGKLQAALPEAIVSAVTERIKVK